MRALILVDLQNDFLPGGALAVPDGDHVVPVANALLSHYPLVVATQDWHPPDHGSFAAAERGEVGDVVQLDGLPQVLWPIHCVQGTRGAELAPQLLRDRIDRVFTKGSHPQVDSYSGFFDNGHRQQTGLADYLRQQGVTEVHVAGLATDYCVKFTALDACELGFDTVLIRDACRGVDLQPGDVDRAIEEMREAGVRIASSEEVLRTSPTGGRGSAAEAGEPTTTLAEGRFIQFVSQQGWEYVRRGNACGVVVVVPVHEGEVLLIEQERVPAGGRVIEFPAGLAGDEGDRHELLQRAAERELREETGYVAARWDELLTCYSSPGLTDEHLTYFWARELRREGAGGGVGGEQIYCHWVPLDEVDRWLAEQHRNGRRIGNMVPAGLQLMLARAMSQ